MAACTHVFLTTAGVRWPGYLSFAEDIKFSDMPGGTIASWAALPALSWVQIVLVVALIYIAVKLSLVAPVIGIDKVYNPFTAIVRSWRLTKGNSLRLFAFFLLLVIALLVVSLVLGLIVALVFGLAGPEVAAIGAGLFNAILNAVYVVIMLGVLAAVHRQLAGPDTEAVTETFE